MEVYEFGGQVGVSSGSRIDGKVFVGFEHLDRNHQIGETLDPKTARMSTALVFDKIESIDVVIEKLESAKRLLKRQMLNLENDEYDYGHDINNSNYGTDY